MLSRYGFEQKNFTLFCWFFLLLFLFLTSCSFNGKSPGNIVDTIPKQHLSKDNLMNMDGNNAKSRMDLRVVLDLSQGEIRGMGSFVVGAVGTVIRIPSVTSVTKISLGGGGEMEPVMSENGRVISLPKEYAGRRVEIGFVTRVDSLMGAEAAGRRSEVLASAPMSNRDFLTCLAPWTPYFPAGGIYQLNVVAPPGLIPVSEADQIQYEELENGSSLHRFHYPYPREFPSLVAGRFFLFSHETEGGILLQCFFLKDDPGLAQLYLSEMERFINMYEGLIGPFPYHRFAVVANRFQTGFAFPTYTLIGDRLLPMPFIRKISLGHEILHSWFGNAVGVKDSGGNWCEGLVTYLADHYFSELQGEEIQWRHDTLAEYMAWVDQDRDMPLSHFQARGDDRSKKAIGYGKAAMVFHMLRREVGDELFFKALGDLYQDFRFRKAGWSDIEGIFSRESGQDMGWFFRQWVDRPGLPEIVFRPGVITLAGDGYVELDLELEQKLKGDEQPWRLTLPVVFKGKGQEVSRLLHLSGKSNHLTMKLPFLPLFAVADPGYDVARKLTPPEIPPMIGTLLGDREKYAIIQQPMKTELIRKVKAQLEQMGFKLAEQEALKHDQVKNSSILVIGRPRGRLAMLIPMPDQESREKRGKNLNEPDDSEGRQADETGTAVQILALKNPMNSAHAVAVVMSKRPELLPSVLARLIHYQKYASLRFDSGGRVVDRTRGEFHPGISIDLFQPTYGVMSTALKPASMLFGNLSDNQVIYMGETHDDMGFHKAQLQALEEIYRSGRPVAVGLEMFQARFQPVLDEYLAGKIDEKEFLKRSEYFERWRFNYHYYRPVIQFCKEHSIPVVALNLPTEVSRKIARSGIQSLTPDERAWLPDVGTARFNAADPAYVELLKEIYFSHQANTLQKFEYFLQAQLAWDITMAANITGFLQRHPDHTMVVLVGSGHVVYGFGIPSHVKRSGIVKQATVVSGKEEEPDPEKADLFIFPPNLPEPFTPKLGVILGDGLKVRQVVKGGPAALAGIIPDDTIVAVDGNELATIEDLRLELFFKKRGARIKITVLRQEKGKAAKRLDLLSGPLEPVDFSGAMRFHAGMARPGKNADGKP